MNASEIFLTCVGALGVVGFLVTFMYACRHCLEERKNREEETRLLEILNNDLYYVERYCAHEFPIVRNICARYRNFIITGGSWDSAVTTFRDELRAVEEGRTSPPVTDVKPPEVHNSLPPLCPQPVACGATKPA